MPSKEAEPSCDLECCIGKRSGGWVGLADLCTASLSPFLAKQYLFGSRTDGKSSACLSLVAALLLETIGTPSTSFTVFCFTEVLADGTHCTLFEPIDDIPFWPGNRFINDVKDAEVSTSFAFTVVLVADGLTGLACACSLFL
jgi:hypothetical protein